MRLSLLQKRGDIYHFRWAVPVDLRPILKRREITKSLNTSSKFAAISAASDLYVLVESTLCVRRRFQAGGLSEAAFRECIQGLWRPLRANTLPTVPVGGCEHERGHVACGEAQEVFTRRVPNFSHFYEYWIAHKSKSGLSDKLKNSYARFYSDWNSLMLDQPISNYRRKEIRGFLLALATAPKRNLKQYKGRGILELLELEIPRNDRVAAKTVDEARKWLQGIFSFAVDQELIPSSPAINLRLQLGSSKPFGNYSDEHVSRMLDRASSEDGWRKWVIWIAAYTGMRRGEIVQINKRDVRFDINTNRHYILVTDEGEGQSLKSVAARRKVPIHRHLESAGFLDFIHEFEGQIFSGLNPQSVTSWFNCIFKEELGIPKISEFGERLVFHSFRHSFITKALSKCEVALVQEVVGHEKIAAGVTNRYNHKRTLFQLLPVIDLIDYGLAH